MLHRGDHRPSGAPRGGLVPCPLPHRGVTGAGGRARAGGGVPGRGRGSISSWSRSTAGSRWRLEGDRNLGTGGPVDPVDQVDLVGPVDLVGQGMVPPAPSACRTCARSLHLYQPECAV